MWKIAERQFSLEAVPNGALLTISDGRSLELNNDEWSMLSSAIEKVLKLPTSKQSRKHRANAGAAWSEEDDRKLREQWRRPGASTRELAVKFQRSSGAIAARLKRLGLTE
jgi:hypothetical protein